MKSRLLTTRQYSEWEEARGRLRHSDIYFSCAYHQAHEANGDGKACAFVAEEGDSLLFYPFLVRPIERVGTETIDAGWCDIETVYGYSGPLASTREPKFLAQAWGAFAGWCQKAGVVAEYVRFHPLLGNRDAADSAMTVAFNRETVLVGLDGTEQELWERALPTQRNMVRKALAQGLICHEVPLSIGLEAFQRMYRQTMAQVQAAQYYLFSAAYFQLLAKELRQQACLFAVLREEQTIAMALFLTDHTTMHYHLAGSDARFKPLAPNNLLLHTAARWAQERGFKNLHLGGGRTARPDDPLLRFKSSLSRARLPFYCGRRVHHKPAYAALCGQWMRQRGLSDLPDYFLCYRLPGDA